MRKYTFTILSILLLSLSLSGNGSMKNKFEIATFGGGCFWCVVRNPDYKMLTSGTTGHAEVVQITFDPEVVSYLELLEIFFFTHDPTTLNSQGADVGTQYRSIVLYHNEAQRKLALEIIEELDSEEVWSNPIVTTVEAFEQFYSAEAYHQEYYENNPNQGYCRLVITPKLEKFEKVFKEKLK